MKPSVENSLIEKIFLRKKTPYQTFTSIISKWLENILFYNKSLPMKPTVDKSLNKKIFLRKKNSLSNLYVNNIDIRVEK